MSTIRDFIPDDESAIRVLAPRLHIGTAAWRRPEAVSTAISGWIGKSIERARRDPAQLKVAIDNGALVGFITLEERQHWSGDLETYIGELVVDASHEGCGAYQRCEPMGPGTRILPTLAHDRRAE